MQRYLLWIDRISTVTGQGFAWLIVVLVGLTSYDVFARYIFKAPTLIAYDLSYYLYATLFMMGGAYALARGQHVRGDVWSRNWPVKVQAGIEVVLMFLFFFPGIIALVSTGYQFFDMSLQQGERTQTSFVQLPLYPLKLVIPVAGAFMLLQGIAETLRAIVALRTGKFPPRLHDVEETETRVAHEEQL